MARRRRNALSEKIMSFIIVCLAIFGGWTLYKEHETEVNKFASKTKKVFGKAVSAANDVVEDYKPTMAVSKSWTCWFLPTDKSLNECRKNRNCYGSRVYGQHIIKKVALKLGNDKCSKEFGECKLEYCEGA